MMVPDSSYYALQQLSGGIPWACLMQPCGLAALMQRMFVPMSVAELHVSHFGMARPALLVLYSAFNHRQRPDYPMVLSSLINATICQMQDGGLSRYWYRCWGGSRVA